MTNLVIDLSSQKLARVLFAYADDWFEALNFVESLALINGKVIDRTRVEEYIKEMIGDE